MRAPVRDQTRRTHVSQSALGPSAGQAHHLRPRGDARRRRSSGVHAGTRDGQRARHLGSGEPAGARMAVRVGRRGRARDLVRASLKHVAPPTPPRATRAPPVRLAARAQRSRGRDRPRTVRARRLRRLRGRPLLHRQLRPDLHLRHLLGRRPGFQRAAGQLVQRIQPVARVRPRAALDRGPAGHRVPPTVLLSGVARALARRRRTDRVRLARAHLPRPRQPRDARVAVARVLRADARGYGAVRDRGVERARRRVRRVLRTARTAVVAERS